MAPYTPTLALRASPTPAWIAAIRARFPVERALDAVLTRKLAQRAEPREQQMDFATLEPRLLAYLRGVTGEPGLRIANLKRLTGGASKEQFTFDLWRPQSGARKLILRMDPLESVVETHRLREAHGRRTHLDAVMNLIGGLGNIAVAQLARLPN